MQHIQTNLKLCLRFADAVITFLAFMSAKVTTTKL